MILIHVLAGLLALLSGGVALAAAKGSPRHRRSGRIFAMAMVVLTLSAVIIAGFLRPNRVNVVAGLLTFYLVATGVLAVCRPFASTRGLHAGLMLLAVGASAYAFGLGFEALDSASGRIDKVPAPPLFMFGVVGSVGALLDARLLLVGHIEGAHRLARHLWRMGYAMWIATLSFFLGQARFLGPIRDTGLQFVPVVLVLGTVVYWLVRVLRGRALPRTRLVRAEPGTSPP